MTSTAVAVVEDGPAYLAEVDDRAPEDRDRSYSIVKSLEDAGVFEPTKLALGDEGLTYEQADVLSHWFGEVKRRSSWWLGDLLLYAEDHFGHEYAQLTHSTGLAEQTLLNIRYVARNVPPERRLAGLGFSVHAVVAKLSAKEQRYWLQRAEKHGWKRDELRAHMKAKRKDEGPEVPIDDEGNQPELALVLEVAEAILRDAVADIGGQHYLVPNEDIARLRAVTGKEV